ncbi:MAG: hypothetical protein H6993_17655 [Pseudomonadales bacterium]|nr:hypothetical protein [Pseudomonadales bacterium]MCP5185794.1 hypothetical protein [Pseudomonadales bacterium]
MPINLTPWLYLGYRSVGCRDRGLAALSSRRWTHAPGGPRQNPPPVFLPGELDRILDFAPSTNAALERQLLFNKTLDQAPTVVHELHNVTLHAGAVWRHDVCIQRSTHSPSWLDFRPLVTSTLSHAMLSATATSAHALEPLLIERLAHCLGEPVLGDHAQAPGDSLPGTAIDTLRSCLPWRVAPADGVRVRRLLLAQESGMNASQQDRLLALRHLLQEKFDITSPRTIVWLRSSQHPAFDIANPEQMAELMDWLNGATVQVDRLPPEELAVHLRQAACVIGDTGTLPLALLLAPATAALICLQAPYDFASPTKPAADTIGQTYAFLVGEPEDAGVYISCERLGRLIDAVTAPSTGDIYAFKLPSRRAPRVTAAQ